MLTQEDLAKHIKIATQNAWRQDNGGGTTLNSMVEYIIRESLAVVMEVLIEQEVRINQLEQSVETLQEQSTACEDQLTDLYNMTTAEVSAAVAISLKEHKENGQNGGLPQPQGNQKAAHADARNGPRKLRK